MGRSTKTAPGKTAKPPSHNHNLHPSSLPAQTHRLHLPICSLTLFPPFSCMKALLFCAWPIKILSSPRCCAIHKQPKHYLVCLGVQLTVKYKFIKTTFIKKKIFIKIHIHQKPLSSKTNFIKNQFHQKTTFIKKPLSSKNHFHQKTTFIKNQFHQRPLPRAKTI